MPYGASLWSIMMLITFEIMLVACLGQSCLASRKKCIFLNMSLWSYCRFETTYRAHTVVITHLSDFRGRRFALLFQIFLIHLFTFFSEPPLNLVFGLQRLRRLDL